MDMVFVAALAAFFALMIAYAIYWHRRRRGSFEKIADSLSLELTSSREAEGRWEGRDCRLEYRAGGRRSPSWLYLRLDIDVSDLPAATFRQEGFFDRIGKALGVSREHQAGEGTFDESIYVEGDREELEYLITDPELRRAIREAVEGVAHSLILEHGTVNLKIKNPFGLTGSTDAAGVREGLRTLGDATDALTEAVEKVPEAPPTSASVTGRTGEDRDLTGGLLMLGAVLFLIAGGIMLVVAEGYPLFTASIFWQALKVGGLLGVLYAALLFVVNRRGPTSTSHRTFLIATVCSLIGLPLTVYGILALTNVFLDPNPPTWIPARIEEIDYDDGQYTAELHASFNGVQGRPEVDVSDRVAEQLREVRVVHLQVGPGYWEEPWVAELRLPR